jgi:SAM-dependent methyltransferase
VAIENGSMMMKVTIPSDYLEKNRDSWNQRTSWHVESAFYDMAGFLAGNTSLKPIELALLGDVQNKTILHLQCHFGQDTISLARMGGVVTGNDLSDAAIAKARELAAQTKAAAEFVCGDLYGLPERLSEKAQTYDLVFASYGTIGWLPDLDRWARIIAFFLKPGGRLVFVEFHPFIWMFDRDLSRIEYSYFNDETILETMHGTYAAPESPITHETVSWNHPLAEVLGALLRHGLTIEDFQEYDYSPYDCLAGLVENETGKFRFSKAPGKIPMVYSIVAKKD